jgi:predicted XRE-type DNA-binding protein
MFLKKRKIAIKKALKSKNVCQKELARELKITESYLSRLVDGTRYSRQFEEFLETVLHLDYSRL